MSDEECPFCGADHVDGRCSACGDRYCDECLDYIGRYLYCPNCIPPLHGFPQDEGAP